MDYQVYVCLQPTRPGSELFLVIEREMCLDFSPSSLSFGFNLLI